MKEKEINGKVDRMKALFDNRKDIRKLREKYQQYVIDGRMIQAMNVSRKIDEEWQNELLREKNMKRNVNDMLNGADPETKGEILTDLYALSFMADMFITVLDDLNSRLDEIRKGAKVKNFDKLTELIKECDVQVMRLLKGSSFEFSESFALNTDELCEKVLDYSREKMMEQVRIYNEANKGKEIEL